MQRRITGILAWSALALLIAVPGSEIILRGTVAKPESASLVQSLPEEKTDLNASTAPRYVGGMPVHTEVSAPISDDIAPLTATDDVLLVQNDTYGEVESVEIGDAGAEPYEQTNGRERIPPYPAPYLTRTNIASVAPVSGVGGVLVSTDYAPVDAGAVAAARNAVTPKQPRTVVLDSVPVATPYEPQLSPLVPFDTENVLEPYAYDEFAARQNATQNWRATSQRGGRFEASLPPTRGSKVRLDLAR